jgi:hypothetical protein
LKTVGEKILSEDYGRHGKIAVSLAADVLRYFGARVAWLGAGCPWLNESSVVSFPAGKPAKAAARNRASKSPNYHLEQLIALRDEYRRKVEILDYAIKLLRSRL